MLQSHVIDIDGLFVGVAIRLDQGFRFRATDDRLKPLDAIERPDMATLRRMARQILIVSKRTDGASTGPAPMRAGHTPVPQPSATAQEYSE